jgi:hypothetical protein
MMQIYVDKIREGKITIDDVPKRWREAVRKALENNTNENKEDNE